MRRQETKYFDGFKIGIISDYFPQRDLTMFQFMFSFSSGISIGYCFLTYQKRKITIDDFIIRPWYRGKGYGSKLWGFVEEYIKRGYKPNEFLGDISDVDDFSLASSFWRKMGFRIIGNKIYKSII